jgi:hypothetical protein
MESERERRKLGECKIEERGFFLVLEQKSQRQRQRDLLLF